MSIHVSMLLQKAELPSFCGWIIFQFYWVCVCVCVCCRNSGQQSINLVCALPNIYYIKDYIISYLLQILYVFVLHKWSNSRSIFCSFLFHLPICLGDLSISGHVDLSHFFQIAKGVCTIFYSILLLSLDTSIVSNILL